ncbi:MAG: 6-phosphogluconolactonase, partial [Solirubrobacteraceae bacterium]
EGAGRYAELLRGPVAGAGARGAGAGGAGAGGAGAGAGGAGAGAGGAGAGGAGAGAGSATGGPVADETIPVLDMVVLGIGPDGHVASLFPGAGTLEAPEHVLCLGVSDSPKPPPERITLSLSVLRAARECLLLASGAGKADAIAAMLGEPTRHVPASLLRRERLTVIVDDAAAPAAAPR